MQPEMLAQESGEIPQCLQLGAATLARCTLFEKSEISRHAAL